MPSPVGHALAGVIVSAALAPNGLAASNARGEWGARFGRNAFTLVTLAAVLPDLDFAWGGHRQETHSLGAAVIAGVAVLAWQRSPRLALAVTLSWASHVLCDWLGSDDTAPRGVMALWPLKSNFYFANAFLFEAISRRYWLDNFISHNVWAVTKEILILGPPAAVLMAVRSRGRRRSRRPDTA